MINTETTEEQNTIKVINGRECIEIKTLRIKGDDVITESSWVPFVDDEDIVYIGSGDSKLEPTKADKILMPILQVILWILVVPVLLVLFIKGVIETLKENHNT